MRTRKEIALDLKMYLHKAVPVADFSVRQGSMGIIVQYYVGDEAFSLRVKKAVAGYFDHDKPQVQFESECGVWVSLYWNPEGKPISTAIYSTVVRTERIPIEGHATMDTLRTHLSCGHHKDRIAYRRKKYGAEKGIKKRVKCWACMVQEHERQDEDHQAFLRSIGLGKSRVSADDSLIAPRPNPS
jgi:hypothetical protein